MILDSLADATPATRWALERLRATPRAGRTTNTLTSVTGRAVLLIMANLADEALNDGRTGYVGTTAEQVAAIIGLAPSTAANWLKALVYARELVTSDSRRFRIPEEAFNR